MCRTLRPPYLSLSPSPTALGTRLGTSLGAFHHSVPGLGSWYMESDIFRCGWEFSTHLSVSPNLSSLLIVIYEPPLA